MKKSVRIYFSKKLMERLDADHVEWRKTNEYQWRNPGTFWDYGAVVAECDNAFKNAVEPVPLHAMIRWDKEREMFFFEITRA